MSPFPPHINPMRDTPSHSNMYQAVSWQPTDPPIHSDMAIAASTAMETFQLDSDDVKEDVQDPKNGMKTIQKMIQHLITPTAAVKSAVGTEPSGLTASTG
jgi:prophage DNA circulation protein